MTQIQAALRIDKENEDRFVLVLSNNGDDWVNLDVTEDQADELSQMFGIEIEEKESKS